MEASFCCSAHTQRGGSGGAGGIKGRNRDLYTVREETQPHSNSEVLRLSLVLGVDVILDHLGQPESRAANPRTWCQLQQDQRGSGVPMGTNRVGFFPMKLPNYRDQMYAFDFMCL